jgi:hypothetical protein
MDWTKAERKAYRKAQRIYWAKLGINADQMWESIEKKWGGHMSMLEFLFGTTILDTENKIIQYDTEKNIGGVGNHPKTT